MNSGGQQNNIDNPASDEESDDLSSSIEVWTEKPDAAPVQAEPSLPSIPRQVDTTPTQRLTSKRRRRLKETHPSDAALMNSSLSSSSGILSICHSSGEQSHSNVSENRQGNDPLHQSSNNPSATSQEEVQPASALAVSSSSVSGSARPRLKETYGQSSLRDEDRKMAPKRRKSFSYKTAPKRPRMDPEHVRQESVAAPARQEADDEASERSVQKSVPPEPIDLCGPSSDSETSSGRHERMQNDENDENDNINHDSRRSADQNNAGIDQANEPKNNDIENQIVIEISSSSGNDDDDDDDDDDIDHAKREAGPPRKREAGPPRIVRAIDVKDIDSSDDEMVMQVEKPNFFKTSAAQRRKERRALASGIRSGRVERTQLFLSPKQEGSGQSRIKREDTVKQETNPSEDSERKPSAVLNNPVVRSHGIDEDASVVDLMDSDVDDEAAALDNGDGGADKVDERSHPADSSPAAERKLDDPTGKILAIPSCSVHGKKVDSSPDATNSLERNHELFSGATSVEEQPNSTMPVADPGVFGDDELKSPSRSRKTPPRQQNVFNQLVYGLTAADQVSFWQGSRFKREPSSFFSFGDDQPLKDADESSSSDESSNEESDDDWDSEFSSDCEASPKISKGATEPPDIVFLRGYEECLPERDPIVPRVQEIKTRDLSIVNNQSPAQMSTVDHMSSFTYDQDGRPVWEFVVYGGCDETLFKFRIDVRPSTIPGAGLGAFMTYLGSLHLNPKLRTINSRVIERRTVHIPKTKQAITFRRTDGQLATLKLTGENLHGNDNNLYWPDTMLPLKASLEAPGRKRPLEFEVHIKGEHIHDDPEFDAMKNRGEKNVKRVGHLGALRPSDYYEGTRDFDLQGSSIYVGRYGPLRRQDRKPESLFLCKSFIFQYVPSGYCFQVGEEINEEVQMVDIMDDTTSTLHEQAVKSLPTYVNEVGHDLSRLQNVFISDYEDRSIEYNFVLPDNQTLKVGSTMELLTNYYDAYETNRQRHGYGLANLFEGRTGDDHPATYMKDRLRERSDILNVVTTINLFQMVDTVEYIRRHMYEPLQKLLQSFLKNGHSSLTSLQLVGLRRLFWLRCRFEEILNLEDDNLQQQEEEPMEDVERLLIAQCRNELGLICSDSFIFSAFHDDRKLKGAENSIGSELRKEALEEACFSLKKRVFRPFDEALWCPIARSLLSQLALLTAEKLWPVEQTTCTNTVVSAQKALLESLMKAAEDAAARIRVAAAKKDFAQLCFRSGVKSGMVLSGRLTEMMKYGKRSRAFFLDHQAGAPKGYVAAMTKRIAYMDCLMLGDEIPLGGLEDIPLNHDDLFVMMPCSVGGNDGFDALGSIPANIKECGVEANATWYIVWQVLFLVEAFARSYCAENLSTDAICDRLGVPSLLGQYAISRGMQTGVDKGFKKCCRPSTKIEYKPQLDLPQSVQRSPRAASSTVEKNSASLATHPESAAKEGDHTSSKTLKKIDAGKPKKKPIAKKPKPPSTGGGGRVAAVLVWRGKPDETIDGGWPEGWTKQTFERQSGATKGQTDSYWYSKTGKKLRSLTECRKFIALERACNGDEELAWAVFRGKAPAPT